MGLTAGRRRSSELTYALASSCESETTPFRCCFKRTLANSPSSTSLALANLIGVSFIVQCLMCRLPSSPRLADVAILLCGALSRYVNHLDEEDFGKKETITVLRQLRTNVGESYPGGSGQQSSPVSFHSAAQACY